MQKKPRAKIPSTEELQARFKHSPKIQKVARPAEKMIDTYLFEIPNLRLRFPVIQAPKAPSKLKLSPMDSQPLAIKLEEHMRLLQPDLSIKNVKPYKLPIKEDSEFLKYLKTLQEAKKQQYKTVLLLEDDEIIE
ncbi:MAG: hypothetical protein ACFFC7_18970 [Candidatus Hermodarchaeota archaeon]